VWRLRDYLLALRRAVSGPSEDIPLLFTELDQRRIFNRNHQSDEVGFLRFSPWFKESDPLRSILSTGGIGTGIPFHAHGESHAELLTGYKLWHAYPPRHKASFDENRPHLTWLREVLPSLETWDRPLQCLQRPGELIKIPEGWWHATVNLSPEVIAVVTQTDSTSPDGYLRHYNAAVDHLANNQPKEAKAAYLQAQSISPLNFLVYKGLAATEFSLGSDEEASLHLKHAIRLNPLSGSLYASLAEGLLTATNPTPPNDKDGEGSIGVEALEAATQAVALSPGVGWIAEVLARVEAMHGDVDTALSRARVSRAQTRLDEQRLSGGRIALGLHVDSDVARLEAAILERPREHDLHRKLSMAYLDRGKGDDQDKALRHFRLAKQLAPS